MLGKHNAFPFLRIPGVPDETEEKTPIPKKMIIYEVFGGSADTDTSSLLYPANKWSQMEPTGLISKRCQLFGKPINRRSADTLLIIFFNSTGKTGKRNK